MTRPGKSRNAAAKKDRVISGLVEARRKILAVALELDPEKQGAIFLGIWSVKHLLAHLVGWDYTNLKAAKEILAGKLPSFYAYYDRDWETYNARLVKKYKRDDFAALVSLVVESHQKLIDFLQTIPADEFDVDTGVRFRGYNETVASLLQVENADEETHYKQIRRFADRSKRR
jgi:uncharacterized damage-inducible protein DinB